MSMSPPTTTVTRSSGSEASDPEIAMDQRRLKRRLSNRESARRSRMRKQQHTDELVNSIAVLRNDSNKLAVQENAVREQLARIESANAVLRVQLAELSDRLRWLEECRRVMQSRFGQVDEDPLLRPWQMPCQQMPITANSADVFLF